MKAKDNQADRGDQPLSEKHHMQIPWYDVIVSEERQADHATLESGSCCWRVAPGHGACVRR